MKPAAARSLGLMPGEITLVITDLQGSTELWEWNPQVMDVANALHAQLARRLLKKYCGHEVTQGDELIRRRPFKDFALHAICCQHGARQCSHILHSCSMITQASLQKVKHIRAMGFSHQ